jgi:hypothetical protein
LRIGGSYEKRVMREFLRIRWCLMRL